MTKSSFGAYLRQLRLDAAMSQRALGAATRLSPSYLARMERGEKPAPPAQTLERLARALDSPELLLQTTRLEDELVLALSCPEARRVAWAALAAAQLARTSICVLPCTHGRPDSNF